MGFLIDQTTVTSPLNHLSISRDHHKAVSLPLTAMATSSPVIMEATSKLGKPYIIGVDDEISEVDNLTSATPQPAETDSAQMKSVCIVAADDEGPIRVAPHAVVNAIPIHVQLGLTGECDVHWPVTGDNWVDTEGDARYKLHIMRYRLRERKMRSMFVPQKWILQIENKRGYHYWFTDATNDTYSLNTILCKTHALNFDSSNPTITNVQFRK